ncbi:hypothetical protein [Yoonia sediminilitoris]|uniref:Uncharacterized protein n=1 Tax=Yoonia sediminilitoris TaxID=1286148 RepID=A0A2T6KDY1_9RHOB|nr:hypothetical protein [Yoonia sediminilitoris]PUB13221.1 hypothetical protein C8N45_108142 [Yoonia sediminilitoris]RCW94556.1 hypothetical protein DFP92_108143 [Yoonia sediminilitoris]
MFDQSPVCYLFSNTDFRVCDGVARGDPLACSDALVMDDIYQFSTDAVPVGSLGLGAAADSQPESRLTFMTQHGRLVDILVVPSKSGILRFLPLSTLDEKHRYRLIAAQTVGLEDAFANFATSGRKQLQSV